MRLNSITLRGIGPYKKTVSVNIDALAGDLTAIVGQNGAGKSIFLEIFPGSAYRDTPTRGSLKSLATARDSLVESVITGKGGQRYTLRHLIDSVSGKAEALVMNEDGLPLNGRLRSGPAGKQNQQK